MLSVQVSPRRKVYVSFCEDTAPNKGGYYCKIYADIDMQFEIDDFVVHNYDLTGAEDKLKKAYKIANNIVKCMNV